MFYRILRTSGFACVLLLMPGLLGGCASRGKLGNFTTVVVDAGHGGHDPGARSRYSPVEKIVALDTALRLERILQDAGFRVVMTRRTDVFIPLGQRAAIGNRAGNAIFVSVHYNWAPRSGARGLETFYFNSVSRPLAVSIQRELTSLPGAVDRGARTARFHVLRNSKQPAVLVEGGFLTNPAEGGLVSSAAYRERVAQAVATGIIRARTGGTTGLAGGASTRSNRRN